MDEEKKNIIQLMLGFVRRANGDHVSAYAAQAAYFLFYPVYTVSYNDDPLYTVKL